jgi:Sugar diacid utilization regulator
MLERKQPIFTCFDLRTIPQLKQAVVRAGSNGLNHKITRVNIMEVPDAINWVQSGEFLITTGYPFRENPNFLVDFIPQLVKKDVAAIGIKTKRFILEIPEKAIETANYYHFPILELPPSTIFSNVVREVMEQIIVNDNQRQTILKEKLIKKNVELKYLDQFLQDWALGKSKDTYDLIFRAKSNGIELSNDNGQYNVLTINWINVELSLRQKSKIVSSFRHENSINKEIKVTLVGGNVVFILIYTSKEPKITLLKKIADFLNSLFPERFSLCIGKTINYPNNLYQSYLQSKRISAIARKCSITNTYITYDDLGIFQILYLVPKSVEIDDFKNRFITPLIEYERKNNTPFIETLMCYFQNNCNVKKTSTKMYTHYNTIVYRLERIKEILHIDLENEEDKLQLQIALKFHQIDSNEN